MFTPTGKILVLSSLTFLTTAQIDNQQLNLLQELEKNLEHRVDNLERRAQSAYNYAANYTNDVVGELEESLSSLKKSAGGSGVMKKSMLKKSAENMKKSALKKSSLKKSALKKSGFKGIQLKKAGGAKKGGMKKSGLKKSLLKKSSNKKSGTWKKSFLEAVGFGTEEEEEEEETETEDLDAMLDRIAYEEEEAEEETVGHDWVEEEMDTEGPMMLNDAVLGTGVSLDDPTVFIERRGRPINIRETGSMYFDKTRLYRSQCIETCQKMNCSREF